MKITRSESSKRMQEAIKNNEKRELNFGTKKIKVEKEEMVETMRVLSDNPVYQIKQIMIDDCLKAMKVNDSEFESKSKRELEDIRKVVSKTVNDQFEQLLPLYKNVHGIDTSKIDMRRPAIFNKPRVPINNKPIIPAEPSDTEIHVKLEEVERIESEIEEVNSSVSELQSVITTTEEKTNKTNVDDHDEEYNDIKLSEVKDNYVHANTSVKNNHIHEDDIEISNTDDMNKYIPAFKSWLRFNDKIVNETSRVCNPIMERLNFLSIAESNLDEFIMTKYHKCKDSAYRLIKDQTIDIENRYDALIAELKNLCGFTIYTSAELKENKEAYDKLEQKFMRDILPILQISMITDTTPNPHLVNGVLFMVVKFKDNDKTAIIRIPTGIGRLVKIPSIADGFMLLEDVLREFLFVIFANTVKSVQIARVLRKAESLRYTSRSKNGERTDYINSINEELIDRNYNQMVFIDKSELLPDSCDVKNILLEIESSNEDLVKCGSSVAIRKRKIVGGVAFVNELKDIIKTKKSMFYEKTIPRIPSKFDRKSMFETISNGDVIVHYPYEDFELATQRFIEEASNDKDVVTIKQTLYRVGIDSPIVESLKQAALNGKEVTVLFELKAKFDEKNNMKCVNILRSSGVNVIFGPLNMKTHAKLSIICRNENGRIAKYANIATGNFNGSTAKVYEDYSLFTKDSKKSHIAYDALMLFNHLGMGLNYTKPKDLLIAPYNMKPKFIELIDRCITSKGEITLKLNGLTDKTMIDKLYEANNAGVKISIICRGMCCLKPGVKGLSENITVTSIIGRYLEHSRVYKFNYIVDDHECEEIYIGSADFMSRNLNNRIEVAVPVTDKDIKKIIKAELKLYLSDTTNSYNTNEEGLFNNPINERFADGSVDVQDLLIQKYKHMEDAKFIIA